MKYLMIITHLFSCDWVGEKTFLKNKSWLSTCIVSKTTTLHHHMMNSICKSILRQNSKKMHESVKVKDVEYDTVKPIYQNLSAMVVPCCTVKEKQRWLFSFQERVAVWKKKIKFLSDSDSSNIAIIRQTILAIILLTVLFSNLVRHD